VASHYGGTGNPVVMSWPKRISDAGGKRPQFHHVIDIAPTIYERRPPSFRSTSTVVKQMPLEGVSMVYTWDKAPSLCEDETPHQYFELFGNRGVA